MEKIARAFAYHQPTSDGLVRIQTLREKFTELAQLLEAEVHPGREKSIAITKLEETAMWAVKGVVLNDPTAVAPPEEPVTVPEPLSPESFVVTK